MKTVDVVIPCYNYGRYLRGCVRSVTSQPGVNVRVLIIDDSSSDDSASVGSELAAENRAVEFRQHAVNKGHIATYNEGLLDWTTADYTVLLSADDLLSPGSLSRAVQVMEADKSVGMVYGPTVHFQSESELPTVDTEGFAFTKWSGTEWLQARCRAGYNVITSPEVVVRGTIQRKVGGYDPLLPHAGDLDMWLRIAAVSNIAYVRRIPQAFYRVHSNSMMRTVFRGSFVDLLQRKAVFDSFYNRHRSIVRGIDQLYAEAMRALAREALWDACRAYDRNEVQQAQAKELEEFALAAYPQAKTLREYKALSRRRQLGPAICNRTQVFAAPALIRRVRRWTLKERWKRHGV